ncbi:MAG: hypothetical protein CMJ18_01365 [Phycisphaeraceae bacterium]|nr:hypothetical protein [Phycisphaeraceae bacterium]
MSTSNDGSGGREPVPDLDANLEQEIANALGDESIEDLISGERKAAPADGAAGDAPEQGEGHVEYELKRGRIASVQDEDVFVTLTGTDARLQGVVPLKQFDRPPRVGSIMDFVLDRIDEAEGLVHLSREGAISATAWTEMTRGTAVEARVVSTNKGGLELELAGRIRAFMPASQVDIRHVDDLESFVGQKLPATVQEIDRRSKRILLSRRQYLETQNRAKRELLMKELEPDQVRDGTVTSIVPYGAFVDLGGADGLVHISDMSYSRIENPSEVLRVGQNVSVKVLKIENEGERIRLGLKQVAPDPWESVAARYNVGDQISGRVVRTASFGAFIEVEPGIEALLPISEMSWKRIGKPDEVCRKDDVLKLSVLQVDPEKHRMSLSLKQVQDDPWRDASERYPAHSDVEGTVVRTTDFGAFVEIETGLEGLIHISQLADRRVNTVDEIVKVGDPTKCRVLEVNEKDRRMSLSIKALTAPGQAEMEVEREPPPKHKGPKRTGPLQGGMGNQGGMGIGLKDLKL